MSIVLGSMLLSFKGANAEIDISRVKMICEVKLKRYNIIAVIFYCIVFSTTNNHMHNYFMKSLPEKRFLINFVK